MSAPLLYSHSRLTNKPSRTVLEDVEDFPSPEKKVEGMMMMMKTRDVGTQSTPYLSSSSPSPTSTPSILERSIKRSETENGDSPNFNPKAKDEEKVEVKETEEEKESNTDDEERRIKKEQIWCRCSNQGGCFSWMRKRQREKHKPRKRTIFLPHFKRC